LILREIRSPSKISAPRCRCRLEGPHLLLALLIWSDLVFQGTFSGGSCSVGPYCNGLFLYRAAEVTPVVLSGQLAPGTKGDRFYSLGVASMNDSGTISFSAQVRNLLTSATKYAVYLAEPQQNLATRSLIGRAWLSVLSGCPVLKQE
jgi:hypothetical protein